MLSAAALTRAAEEPAVAVHYNKACSLRDQGDVSAAIEEVAKGIALNPQDRDWLAKSELLIAVLYQKTGLLKSAAVTARQVELLYAETEFEKEAKALLEQINQLIEQSEQAE
jgi:hypothetical protein